MELDYLNYKQPLKPVENGHGYYGTIAQTKNHELVQCHVCGELCANLGSHAWTKHNIKAIEYRATYQLGRTTPLCSDAWSQKYKQMKLEMWANMTEEQREERKQMMRTAQEKARRIGNPRSLEALNKDGMCPDQLLQRIQECADALGKSPSYVEFKEFFNGKYVGATVRTFGSWSGAKKMLDLAPCKTGTKIGTRRQYSNEELLAFLQNFYKEKGYKPTHSDWVRGFLPSYDSYKHRFGGIQKARELAGML